MLVVSDIEDMFVPLLEGFLVDPFESRLVFSFPHELSHRRLTARSIHRTAIESLFDALPKLVEETSVVEAAIVGPLKAAMLSLVRLRVLCVSCARANLDL